MNRILINTTRLLVNKRISTTCMNTICNSKKSILVKTFSSINIDPLSYTSNNNDNNKNDNNNNKNDTDNNNTKVRVPIIDEFGRSYGTGRRKTSVARVWIKDGIIYYY